MARPSLLQSDIFFPLRRIQPYTVDLSNRFVIKEFPQDGNSLLWQQYRLQWQSWPPFAGKNARVATSLAACRAPIWIGVRQPPGRVIRLKLIYSMSLPRGLRWRRGGTTGRPRAALWRFLGVHIQRAGRPRRARDVLELGIY
jgi:hypothetical protein